MNEWRRATKILIVWIGIWMLFTSSLIYVLFLRAR
jgi:hypothetical protein